MKGFKGTPGPWSAVRRYYGEVSVIDSDGFKVVTAERAAILMDWDKKGFEHWADDGGNRLLSGPEQFANANLIAAAPDLLEALLSIVNMDYQPADDESDKVYLNARAAISKALGEE